MAKPFVDLDSGESEPFERATSVRAEYLAALERSRSERATLAARADSPDEESYQRAFRAVRGELAAALARYGRQTMPDVAAHGPVARSTTLHGLPTEREARELAEGAFARRAGSWAHLVVEELCEAVEAAQSEAEIGEGADADATDAEIAQTAALLVAWLANRLRRREGRK